jgi:hypothetical protein
MVSARPARAPPHTPPPPSLAAGEDQRELLAAVPCAERVVGQSPAQLGGDPVQDAVPEPVPEGVVHLLEVICVDQGDAQVRRPPVGQHRDELLVEVATVVALGEAVAVRQLAGLGVLAAQAVQLVRRTAVQEPDGRAEVLVRLLPPAQRGELLGGGGVLRRDADRLLDRNHP